MFAYIAGILVLLIVVAAVVLPMVIDPNDYKDDIAAAAHKYTGRELTIEGDIGLSVFPWLAFETGPTTLSNAAGFSAQPFAHVDAVQVRIKLLPLLRKEIQMDTVVLEGLRLSLEKNADGVANWDDLTSGDGVAEAPVDDTGNDSGGAMALGALAIGGVRVTDANIRWDDRSSGAQYDIRGLNLATGAIKPGETVPVELDLQLSTAEPQVRGPLEFSAQVLLSEDGQQVRVEDGQLTANLLGEGLPGGVLDSRVAFELSLDLAGETLDVSQLTAELLGLQLVSTLTGQQIFGDAGFAGTLELKPFEPRELIKALGQPLPETSDPKALDSAQATMNFKATLDSLALSDLHLQLDESSLTGQLGASHFANPAIRYTLHLDQIDVDRYLPPPAENGAVPATPATAAAAGAQLIPVEMLRTLDIDGILKIDRLKVSQLRSEAIEMKLLANKGELRVHPARAKLYEGQYDGDVRLDVRGKQPKITLNENLQGVQVGPLLRDMLGDDKLSGATKASASLTATGNTTDALTRTLNGKIGFAFTDGAVKGFNLAAMIRKAEAKLSGQPVPEEKVESQTDFSELTGTAVVTNGILRNRDLLAKSPLLRVQGEGDINLPQQTLDYLVTAKVVGSLEGQGGKGLSDLKGVPVPVQLSGTFAEPKYKIRLDKALSESAQTEVKKKLNKEIEKQLGDKLKGLFN